MTATRFYDAKQMAKVAAFLEDLQTLITAFEGDEVVATAENPLYVYGLEIVIRHHDDYTIGRIAMDDFLYYEGTEEDYVSAAEAATKEGAS